jgi:hypothetical protein
MEVMKSFRGLEMILNGLRVVYLVYTWPSIYL